MKFHKYHYYSIIIIMIGIGLTAGIMIFALKKNINLYYTTKDACFDKIPMDTMVYLEGVVKFGSVQKNEPNHSVIFNVIDGGCEVSVHYIGTLPTLFKPGRQVVLQGNLISTHSFVAKRVLAKHNNVYIPKQKTKKG